MTIIVDSDGLIGSINPQDSHYIISQKILSKLIKNNSKLIYPATVIAESVTFLQGKFNNSVMAKEVLRLVTENLINIEPVDGKTLRKANIFMNLQGSKHNTLFDCVVAAIAVENNADAIFSFDGFYKKNGFKLASEL